MQPEDVPLLPRRKRAVLWVSSTSRPELHRPGWPVIEVFGPTIQGEGPDAGRRCWFVRFGGCDFRCTWCDSMFAVEPEQVRATATRMVTSELLDQLTGLGLPYGGHGLVILSGGNPALHDLTDLVTSLHAMGVMTSVETQGSVYKPWLAEAGRLVVSPKPPSSGMATPEHALQLDAFLDHAVTARRRNTASRPTLKFVVAGETDYMWAKRVAGDWPSLPVYLSALTPQDDENAGDDAWARHVVGESYRWVCERAARDTDWHPVVLPQLHVIAWGTRQGV